MARFVRKFTKRFFIVSNIVFVIFFLFACANAWLNPVRWWFFSILGLVFPVLLILDIGFIIFWAIFRSRWVILPLAALVLAFTNLRVLIGFHVFSGFEQQKEKGSIRILTWNVAWFDAVNEGKPGHEGYREKMFDFIREQDPDIVCFQEYNELRKRDPRSNMGDMAKMGFVHYFKSIDYGKEDGPIEVGAAIFSKFPIEDTFRVRYPGPLALRASESLIGCDLTVNGRPIRLYTTHLQSVLFKAKDYQDIQAIKNADDSFYNASKSIVRKLRQAYALRSYQADLVRQELDNCPRPEILTGDFNDVPNSYTYFRIKGDRQDAFVRKGSGISQTFTHISPTLRIDYVLADKAFDVLQYKRVKLPYSDHYPVVVDLKLAEDSH